MQVVLISTYDLGRQPFGLASPAAFLRREGYEVQCVDLTRTRLPEEAMRAAGLVAFFLPMHTATRMAVPVIARVRALNPEAHLCAYGLYAPLNADLLRARGIQTVLGPEFEAQLVALAARLQAHAAEAGKQEGKAEGTDARTDEIEADSESESVGEGQGRGKGKGKGKGKGEGEGEGEGKREEDRRSARSGMDLPRVAFQIPDRTGLPPLTRYAALQIGDRRKTVGYTEATRGCKHRCRHCPIVPVYNGRFRAVPADVVLADVRAQVAAGAGHITFGDPDFFNGPTHAVAIVTALAREFPGVTYDAIIKVEHLRQHAPLLPLLRRTGCAFVTTAVESFDDAVLAKLEKGHTHADFKAVAAACAAIGLPLSPTFLAFTPWTTIDGYVSWLAEIERLGLTDAVAPIQYAIRLLIPDGSLMLELGEVRRLVERFDASSLTHVWRHPDARVDALQQQIERFVGSRVNAPRAETFTRIRALVHAAAGIPLPPMAPLPSRATVPYLNEPWYC